MKNRPAESIQFEEERAAQASPCAPSLDELARACAHGDPSAQQRFYETLRDDVYQVVLRIVGRNDAPDLLQQSFVQAFRSIDRFENRSSVRTWLYRLAVNECLQFLRRAKSKPVLPLDMEPMDPSPGHELELDDKELLEQALAKLEPGLRAAFVLREVERMTYAQIAAALEIPEGTVASRLNAARRKLRAILLDLGWER